MDLYAPHLPVVAQVTPDGWATYFQDQSLGVVLLVLGVLLILRGWLRPGFLVDREVALLEKRGNEFKEDRDFWRRVALTNARVADKQTDLLGRVTGEEP